MAPQLYALKEDIDMLAAQIKDMKKGYGTLDYIVKSLDSFEQEQLFQSAQIGRIFVRLDRIEIGIKDLQRRMSTVEERLDNFEQRLIKLEQRVDKVEQRLDKVEQRLGKMEKILLLICAKLEIDTSSL